MRKLVFKVIVSTLFFCAISVQSQTRVWNIEKLNQAKEIVEQNALVLSPIAALIANKEIKKIIIVPNKIVNIVL